MSGKKPARPPEPDRRAIQALARYAGLGMEMAVAVVGTALLGQWLDRRANHENPVYTLVFAFVGVIYVMYRLFRISSSK